MLEFDIFRCFSEVIFYNIGNLINGPKVYFDVISRALSMYWVDAEPMLCQISKLPPISDKRAPDSFCGRIFSTIREISTSE